MKPLIACLIALIVVLGFVLKPDAAKPVVETTPIEKAVEMKTVRPETSDTHFSAVPPSVAEADSAALVPSEESAAHAAQRSVAPASVAAPHFPHPQDPPTAKAADRRTAAAEQGGLSPLTTPTRPSFSVPQSNSFAQVPIASDPALASNQEILVPQGGRLPAALIDLDQTTPQQAQAADQIAESFLNVVSNGAPEVAQPRNRAAKDAGAARGRAWEAARAEADERYRQLFGDEAYKAYSNAAAIEALREKQVQANPK
jgi:hypothetical protein